MQSAVDSSIGLPSRPTSSSLMLAFFHRAFRAEIAAGRGPSAVAFTIRDGATAGN
jgi:hypothetical protein